MELVVSFSGCYTFEPALGCHCQQRPTNIRLILQVGTFNNHEHLCQQTSCSINKGLLSQIGSYTDSSGRKKIFLFFFISRTKKGKKRKTEQDVNARKLVELHIHVSQNLNYWSSDSKGVMRLMKF